MIETFCLLSSTYSSFLLWVFIFISIRFLNSAFTTFLWFFPIFLSLSYAAKKLWLFLWYIHMPIPIYVYAIFLHWESFFCKQLHWTILINELPLFIQYDSNYSFSSLDCFYGFFPFISRRNCFICQCLFMNQSSVQ